jgi:ankyrin repeat protein
MSELFDAIRRGDAAAVKSVVEGDPQQASARQNKVSAILTALYHGRNDIAQLLVNHGARLDFHEACALGDLVRVRTMLEATPSRLDEKSADGYPAVGLAIFFRHPDVAKFLIERGADVNAAADNPQRVAPLHAAASVSDRDTMKLLLERGADPNARQQMDYTALHGAASRGDVEMARMLLAHGADAAARTSDGMTVAEFALKYKQPEFAEWLGGRRMKDKE